ncbi:16S rRNA (guanine1516-N2)-methyltransferase [Marinobacter daqiaonensis]|uniref:Ribosomal RNA small subunit methyltransferase J n=1 Tax=Marinobacter daqiaonensis TaxID=650891 RepID=A0A1I6J8I3_9GAMM|nr:class I SAM-dependent methyltransferase [Marinobacter daqiaonensis]SFR75276.1 16S rRNA (guanine1516-N2)-methyltransferase [Marinobacter daqiaonensis]
MTFTPDALNESCSSPIPPVAAASNELLAPAQALATSLGSACLGVVEPRDIRNSDLVLHLDRQGLSLQVTGRRAPGPVRAEFVTGKAGYRLAHGGGTGQMIAKAVGLKRTSESLHVLDATAGLGQDGFVLAGLGQRITMLERSPVIHALLADGLARAAGDEATAAVAARITLIRADSIDWLGARAGGEPVADVIHLDPMFPHRDKSAAVKKEMQLFRPIVGDDPDAANLLEAALACARYRVVVKRSRRAPVIPGPAPSLQLEGKSSRYDIYPLRALPTSRN